MKSIGIIGLGTLGTAIALGLRNARPQWEIFATRRSAAPMPGFVTPCRDNRELVERTRLVLICVKPQQVPGVLEEIHHELKREHIIVSACAGISLEAIGKMLPEAQNIARAMPSITCEVNAGITAICFSERWKRNCRDDIVQLFESTGKAIILDERHFDAVTAISGCGPAYMCLIMEALIDAGVKEGLPRDAARLLVTQTLLGSARLVLESGKHPAEIRDRVTTPGGCTIHALAALEEGKLRATLISAVSAAAEHSRVGRISLDIRGHRQG